MKRIRTVIILPIVIMIAMSESLLVWCILTRTSRLVRVPNLYFGRYNTVGEPDYEPSQSSWYDQE